LDAAQQAVVVAMLGLRRLRDDGRFGAWLIGIGLNVCRALMRERGRKAGSLDRLLADRCLGEPARIGADPAIHAEAEEVSARVREAIAVLPAGQRDAVTLFYLAGMTHTEIAEQLRTAPGAIKTRLHKARGSLRAPLNELWKENFAMSPDKPDVATSAGASELVRVRIADLRRTAESEPESARNVVFLEEEDGGRRLPIWIGSVEAGALAVILDRVELPRPWTYEFAARLLAAAGAALREIRIVDLANCTFYAQAVLTDGTVVDARPSDALALALHLDAPIYVAEPVLARGQAASEGPATILERPDYLRQDAKALADEVRVRLRAESDRLRQLSAG
jgi:RNA polymerase sigma factor (sigma-70 family)